MFIVIKAVSESKEKRRHATPAVILFTGSICACPERRRR